MVPQSSSVIVTSCATSTNRRARYPASAVFSAVSASPLRAPVGRDESTRAPTAPSRKFDLMGLSMISPIPPVSFFCGLAIEPCMPASCRIWSREPRAAGTNIMNTGLKPSLDFRIVATMASAMSLFAWVQAFPLTLLYRSPKRGCRPVGVRPLEPLHPLLPRRGAAAAFSTGISRSAMPIETPPLGGVAEPEILRGESRNSHRPRPGLHGGRP